MTKLKFKSEVLDAVRTVRNGVFTPKNRTQHLTLMIIADYQKNNKNKTLIFDTENEIETKK